MATVRGFVQQIEVGRAGLVTVTVIHADGSLGDYVIRDLDADPERFNERLSKLAILRDAMDRAEPVEIESTRGESGEEIERAVRITRDALSPPGDIEQVVGLVLNVHVYAPNAALSDGENHDGARVTLLSTDLTSVSCVLDLQAPERKVAAEQLEMLLDAQSRSRLVRLALSTGGTHQLILAVSVDVAADTFGGGKLVEADGFVESLSLFPPQLGGALGGSFAHFRFTTAPAFTGSGNTVSTASFTPETVDLLVPRNSLTYQLIDEGLRWNLRMRVAVARLGDRKPPDKPQDERVKVASAARKRGMQTRGASEAAANVPESLAQSYAEVLTPAPGMSETVAAGAADPAKVAVAFAAELLAPLASASRPVWVAISRESLDRGPDAITCTPGLPTSDLTPRTLRDLRIPYAAQWEGEGAFNAGVYRFQLQVPADFRIYVDCEELCVFDAEDQEAKIAHACIEAGCHCVKVVIDQWLCDYEFIMDVYRLR